MYYIIITCRMQWILDNISCQQRLIVITEVGLDLSNHSSDPLHSHSHCTLHDLYFGRGTKRKEVGGITTGLFRFIKLLALVSSIMAEPPWSWFLQGFSDSHSMQMQPIGTSTNITLLWFLLCQFYFFFFYKNGPSLYFITKLVIFLLSFFNFTSGVL